MAYNKIVDRYFCICQRCGVRRFQEKFPRSKTDPVLPGLYCKRCQRKIDHPPKPKLGKTRLLKLSKEDLSDPKVVEAYRSTFPSVKGVALFELGRLDYLFPTKFDTLVCRALRDDRPGAGDTPISREMLPWVVYTGHGTERYYLGAGRTREEAIKAAEESRYFFPCPERPGDELGTEPEFVIKIPSLNGEKIRFKPPEGVIIAIIRMRDPGYPHCPIASEPYVIPPSKSDPSKPYTRFERDAMGYIRLYVHDECVGVRDTWRSAVKDACGQRHKEGRQVLLIEELLGNQES